MAEFRSFFAPLFKSFIYYRKASGRWNSSSYEPFLILFDRFCALNYPEDEELTQEMVDSWCKQREGEMNNSCRSRIYVVVSFVRYLCERGLTHIAPPELPRKEKRRYLPHAFTQEELGRFFSKCDNLTPYAQTLQERSRQITVPVFFACFTAAVSGQMRQGCLKERMWILQMGCWISATQKDMTSILLSCMIPCSD